MADVLRWVPRVPELERPWSGNVHRSCRLMISDYEQDRHVHNDLHSLASAEGGMTTKKCQSYVEP